MPIQKASEEPAEPLVSVIMSAHAGDSPADLERSLDSILRQEYPRLEVVLVLDGPVSEELRGVVKAMQESSSRAFVCVPLRENAGLGTALNAAIAKAKGDYLARMDADDVSYPLRIRRQIEYLRAHPDVDVVGCGMRETFPDGSYHDTAVPLTHEDCAREFMRRNPIHHATALFRRRYFEKAGLYAGHICEDLDLWLKGFRAGCRFGNVDSALYQITLDDRFFSRRNDLHRNLLIFRRQLRNTKELGFGLSGCAWAILRLAAMLLLPRALLKKAYRVRSRFWRA